MATTEIHAITQTPERALGYVVSDKIVEYVSDDEIHKEIPYRIFEDNSKKYIQYSTLTTYQNCNVLEPLRTYKETQEKFQGKRYKSAPKTKSGDEVVMWHLHQSFNGFEVDAETANEIGRKLAAEIFKGFTVTISTHGNTDNIHNHFVICAWDSEGKKWNNCNSNYRNIRKVSDRLCEEYGLNVLDKTRDMKLIKYEDKDGNIRYYEPTDRKNELIRKREAGEISTDDVRSYRNTPQYQEIQEKKTNNRDTIKSDIDNVLPTCRSYEELLERLRGLGYTIRDKKKSGEWLSHIAFQAPLQDKATREDKIGENNFYCRENLTKYIEERAVEMELEEPTHGEYIPSPNVPYFEEYEYGKTDINKIDNEYKTVRNQNGDFTTIQRTATEKKVISDIRIKDNQVRGLIDTTKLHKIIAEQNTQKRYKRPYISTTQEHKLVAQIQSSFQCLKYTEQNHIFSYKQIIDLYGANKEKYNATIDNFTKAENAIEHLKDVLLIPKKLSDILNDIESKKGDVSYLLEEYNKDKKTIEQYKATMIKYKIDTPHGENTLKAKVTEYEAKQNANRGYMASVLSQMVELENCIRTFDRIDRENGTGNDKAMREFELLVGNDKSRENAEQENRKRKGKEER